MVETLEPLYGAFRSMGPYFMERGKLASATRTQLGSEVREYEVEGEGVTASSAKVWRDVIVAQGRPVGDQPCRIALTFAPRSAWRRSDAGPGPTWAELDQAESLPKPDWIIRPTAQTFIRHYPPGAVRREIDGHIVLDCIVAAGGALACRVAHEAPADEGFGAAALGVAREMRLRLDEDGTPLGRRVRVPVKFRVMSSP